jgi:hypothetical protein
MVNWKHSVQPVQDTSASQSVRAAAARGDRARRVSAAKTLIARGALPAAVSACLASAVAPLLGGPERSGLFVLAAGVVAAGLTILLARYYPRVLRDHDVAEVDRAADLDGSLRSAHWFAVNAAAGAGASPWIARHLEEAASRAADVDWPRIFRRRSPHLRWAFTMGCVIVTVGLTFKPLPRRSRPAAEETNAAETGPGPTTAAPGAPSPLVPQILEGMKAMRAGRTPSEEQLTAIGQALETAKQDPAARKRIEGEVRGSGSNQTEIGSSSSSDTDSAAWSNDYQNGFEMSDLDWAYQEAMARGRNDEATRQDPAGEVTGSRDTNDATGGGRRGEPAASGEATGAPVQGDTRGRPMDLTSLLLGKQQASAGSGTPDPPPDTRRAKLTAALRSEVVHASSDVTLPNPDLPSARRATNASQTPGAAPGTADHVKYDRSRAAQPPAVPAARRPLVREFFLRSADPVSTVKRP